MKSSVEVGMMATRLALLSKLGVPCDELIYDGWATNDVIALQNELEVGGWEMDKGSICKLSKDACFRYKNTVVYTMASDFLGSFISVRVYA